MTVASPLDQVILVDENDVEIGAMDKVEAHRGKGKLHRAISVYLFRKNGDVKELLIQKRSQQKIVGAGQWANTCCGNVRPGETYEMCAQRRLREELGIQNTTLQPLEKFQYFAKCNEEFSESEIDQVFAGWFSGELELNPAEVSEVAWVPFEKITQEKYTWAPWFAIMLQKSELMNELRNF